MTPRTITLTGRRAAFVRGILAGLNPTEAALRAGYKPSNAAQTARRLLKSDPNVVAAVEAAAALKREGFALANEALVMAKEAGDAMALVEALTFKAKLAGLIAA